MGIMRRIKARMSTWSKSSRIKPQRIAAAVCFACACAIVVWILTPDQGGTSVVVANRNLPPGSELRTQDLTVVEFPTQLVPDKVFTAVSDAEHKRTSAGLSKGSPLTQSAVLDQQALPEGNTDLLMPVRLADNASAALLQPGQRIRLFSSLPDGGSEVVVKEVTIARLVDKPEGITSQSGQLVSVILSSDDAERIAEFAGMPISFAILPQ
ncbi:MAG: SAF domain-containing protein [Brevibacterium sp.]|uniref:SAF domain-containing protein n=1 Tax=Brevibacterium sandarakinum TaxID=629680 RepID=UPI00264EBDAD|nr:SAF domain-containing protein [Brevibacterium sandarakinum]MDN5586485.1 SAF domain-containing protein [Brevibacterium sp.]MDN5634116.1 SAF domain-containing protein [Brevibacterium sp.]MDN5657753.1 SAF domain-containing protein [Brevibacterium sandarakinum]